MTCLFSRDRVDLDNVVVDAVVVQKGAHLAAERAGAVLQEEQTKLSPGSPLAFYTYLTW